MDAWTATVIDAKGGIIRYIVPKDILDVDGIWKMWSYITYAEGPYPGVPFEIEIYKEGDLT